MQPGGLCEGPRKYSPVFAIRKVAFCNVHVLITVLMTKFIKAVIITLSLL